MGGEKFGLDALSREMMQKLMQTEEFQLLWTDIARSNRTLVENFEATERRNQSTKVTHQPRNATSDFDDFYVPKIHFNRSQNKTELNSLNLPDKLIANELRQFVSAIRLAVDAFAIGTRIARFEDQLPPTKVQSHEPVSLYMAHVRLERFCASEHFHVGKFGLAARQIANLLRMFTQRVSSVYSVERCSFLAESLLRLLFKFYERIRWHCRQNPNGIEVKRFGEAIQKFDTCVCRTLRQMLSLKKPRADQTLATIRHGLHVNLPSPAAIPILLLNGKTAHHIQKKQRGFFLSPELDYDRNRTSLSTHSAKNGGNSERKKRVRNDHWENKRCKGRDFLRLAKPGEIAALREMCKLTLECINEMMSNTKQ